MQDKVSKMGCTTHFKVWNKKAALNLIALHTGIDLPVEITQVCHGLQKKLNSWHT